MISRITIKNFKSIGLHPVDIELKPLTLLVGPNGSGKSSIIEALLVASQRGGTPGPLLQYSARDALHRQQPPGNIEVAVYFDGDGYSLKLEVGESGYTTSESYIGPGGEAKTKLKAELLDKVFPLSSLRGDVPLSSGTGSSANWVGMRGENLVPLLAVIFGQRKHDKTAAHIARWAKRFGVPGLKAGYWGGSELGADYQEEALNTTLRLALASAGSRQTMSIITQLFSSPRRSIILIEEPEISLHPKAQIEMTEVFAEAVKQEKQIIATTHSTFLVLALGATVQKRLLKAGDIAIYHVEKKPEVGTVATRLPVNERGYVEGWIPSFAKEERKLLREWWKTVPEETAPAEQ